MKKCEVPKGLCIKSWAKCTMPRSVLLHASHPNLRASAEKGRIVDFFNESTYPYVSTFKSAILLVCLLDDFAARLCLCHPLPLLFSSLFFPWIFRCLLLSLPFFVPLFSSPPSLLPSFFLFLLFGSPFLSFRFSPFLICCLLSFCFVFFPSPLFDHSTFLLYNSLHLRSLAFLILPWSSSSLPFLPSFVSKYIFFLFLLMSFSAPLIFFLLFILFLLLGYNTNCWPYCLTFLFKLFVRSVLLSFSFCFSLSLPLSVSFSLSPFLNSLVSLFFLHNPEIACHIMSHFTLQAFQQPPWRIYTARATNFYGACTSNCCSSSRFTLSKYTDLFLTTQVQLVRLYTRSI